MSIELGNIITYNPLTVKVEDTLELIFDLLPGLPFHHWPVVDDEHRLVGVLSDQDLIAAFAPRMAMAGGTSENSVPLSTTVGEVMSRDVLTVSETTSVEKALALMLQRRIHCVPVMNGSRLVAILTTTDLLREFSFGELAISRETVNEHLVNCLDFLTPNATLTEAQEMLDAEQTDCLPVMQGSCPVGIVTRRQLRKTMLWQLLQQHSAQAEGPLMLDSVLECVLKLEPVRPGQKLSSAATGMVEHSAQAVAVVNQAKRMMGVITEEIILRLMQGELAKA